MKISNEAKEQLLQIIDEEESSNLRFFAAGGCGGTQLGLGLEEPAESDIKLEVNGIRVSIESSMQDVAKDIELDLQESSEGVDFVIKGLPNTN
ncbi:adhesin [Pontibacillus sp. ALD_SL1]|uniref:adhesin n=1 Tax=Pontibacillus sp. ALD_SL1 TaxID=2777185 RepID=UPI001A974FC2|nr:adhesin [Pontibacillus sp. ALD_SL1]QST00033.1 adhesin [Pontibacillus sp. ALD_SL1]